MRRFVTSLCGAVAICATGSSVLRANVDPPFTALASSSYYGQFGLDEVNDLAVDADGFVYLAGGVDSTAGLDGFVVKLTPDGSQVVYATAMGGSDFDVAMGLAIDPNGGVFVVGHTTSADFPLVNPFQSALNGDSDAWVARLDDNGTLVYASYYGGESFENGSAIALGPTGDVYVAGSTGSLELPGATGAQPTYGGGFGDGFIAKFSPDGSALIYASYFGGGDDEFVSGLAVDTTDHAYVVGGTGSIDFPTAAPLQPAYGGGFKDGFLTSFSPDGTQFVLSTYFGGLDWDQIHDVATDAGGRVYLTGMTWSLDFPTRNAFQAFHAGGLADAFLGRLAPGGMAIDYATFFGGSGYDVGVRVFVDGDGQVHFAGETDSVSFPLIGNLQDQANGTDAFYARLSSDGQTLLRSTPLGGSGIDAARGLGLNPAGDAWIGGVTDSADFPIVNAFQQAFGGASDAFVSRLTFTSASNQPPIAVAGSDQIVFTAGCATSVVLDGSLSSDADGDPLNLAWSGPGVTTTGAVAVLSLLPGEYTFTLTVDDGRGGVTSDTVAVTVIDNAGPQIETVGASPDVLGPPNHQMVDVTVSVGLADTCGGSSTCRIVGVTSSEPVNGIGDGDTAPDWEVTGPLSLRLRAERAAHSQGRIYTITIECVDKAGNGSQRTVIVSVSK